jgi:hypothetical protein
MPEIVREKGNISRARMSGLEKLVDEKNGRANLVTLFLSLIYYLLKLKHMVCG